MARSFSYQWGRTNRISSTRNDEEQLQTDLVIVVTDPGTPAGSGTQIYTRTRIDAGSMLTALRNGELQEPLSSGPLVVAEGSNVVDGGGEAINLPDGVVGSIEITEEPNAQQGRVYRVTVTTSLHADRSSFQPASVKYAMQANSVAVQAFRADSEDDPLLIPTDEGWTQIGTTSLYKITAANWYDYAQGMNPTASVTGDPIQRNSSGTEVATDRPAGDIGGIYVDWSGKPIQFPLAVTTHTITVVRNAPFLNLGPAATPTTCIDYGDQTTIQNHQGFIGKRNVGDFFRTGDAGRIMLKSISMQPLGQESQSVTYTFVEHPWSHAVQVPRQTFGSGFFAMKYLGDPRLIQHTIGVYWQQPHQYGANFQDAGVVFTDAELRLISELYDSQNTPTKCT